MTSALAPFDDTDLPSDQVQSVRAAAERIRLRMKRTAEDIIEIGRDLLEVKRRLAHGQFGRWIETEFGMSDDTARNFMHVAERFGQQIPNYSGFAPTVLIALANAPPQIVAEVTDRTEAGEKFTVAEIERLKREAKTAQETARRLERERSDLLARAEKAASHEQEARDHLRLVRQQAAAAQRQAAQEARAAAEAEIAQANQEAAAARAEAMAIQATLEDAVRQARAEAEQAARDQAEALAAEALARRKGDLAEIERHAKAAEDKARRHYEAEQRLAAEIREHQDFLARTSSAEHEATVQIAAADALMAALTDMMIALHGFEHAPVPQAARKLDLARQMCGQTAEAISAFLAPRLPEAG